ncbi:MAG: hypothetical protein ACW981_03345 [Candidatus Hodarchaeales archaeon]
MKSLVILPIIVLLSIGLVISIGENMKFDDTKIEVLELKEEYFNSYKNSLSKDLDLNKNFNSKLKLKLLGFPQNTTYLYNQSNFAFLHGNKTDSVWILENNSVNQIIYFEIRFNNTPVRDNIEFSIVSESLNVLESLTSKIINSTSRGGSFSTITSEDWFFILNVSNPLILQPTNYEIVFHKPLEGYSFESAKSLNIEITSVSQFSNYLETIDFREETVFYSQYYFATYYFSFKLHSKQRIDVSVIENAGNILENARISIFSPRPNLPPDFITYTNETANTDGEIHTTWVGPTTHPSSPIDDFWLEIRLQQAIKGNFTISLDYQKDTYSFNTAKYIPINSTIIDSNIVDFFDPWDDIRYYVFEVNQSDIEVFIEIKESIVDSGSINNAVARIFDSGKNTPILTLEESDSKKNGLINGSFYVESPGIYYIELDLSEVQFQGSNYEITISLNLPSPFIWKIDNIIITLFSLIAIPSIALGYDLYLGKNSHYWDVTGPKKSVYKFISENPRFRERSEVPSEKMMFILPYYLGTYILEFTSPSEENTSISLISPNKSGLRFFYYLPVGIFVYWLINSLKYLNDKSTALWFQTQDNISFSIIAIFLLLLTGIPALLVLILRYNYVDLLKRELDYSTTSYITQSLKEISSDRQITIEDANKMLSYVRVLWNQAKKAFKEKNYSLFIIKADSAVKKLIELRFLQLMGYVADKLTFEEIIEKIRENAFDVPSSKKIEYFRKVRNKVVHSSHLLEEKTAIETFSYYNKFLTRLGLRT